MNVFKSLNFKDKKFFLYIKKKINYCIISVNLAVD